MQAIASVISKPNIKDHSLNSPKTNSFYKKQKTAPPRGRAAKTRKTLIFNETKGLRMAFFVDDRKLVSSCCKT
jgi:hypothetical protein